MKPDDAFDQEDGYTVIVRRPVEAGSFDLVEAKVREVLQAAKQHPGHRGTVVLRGGTVEEPELFIVHRFRSKQDWFNWRNAPDHTGLISELERVTGIEAEHQFAEGLESWFTLPGVSGFSAPSKSKMALVTWLAIFPLLILVAVATEPVLDGWSWIAQLSIRTAITVPLMTWLVMPAMTRMLNNWLYP